MQFLGAPINLANPVNYRHALAKGLRGWWMVLPGMGGNLLYDLTALPGKMHFDSHATLTNMNPRSAISGIGPTNRRGSFGQLNLDGTNDWAKGNHGRANGGIQATRGTMCGWCKYGDQRTSRLMTSGSDIIYIGTNVFSATKLSANVWNGTTTQHIEDVTNFVVNAWTHVAGTWDGATIRLYVNGALVGSTAGTGATYDSGAGAVNIGCQSGDSPAGNFFLGALDDLRIYDRVLSPAHVFLLYQDSLQGYPRTLNRIARIHASGEDLAVPVITRISIGLP